MGETETLGEVARACQGRAPVRPLLDSWPGKDRPWSVHPEAMRETWMNSDSSYVRRRAGWVIKGLGAMRMNRTKGMMLGVGLALVATLNCQPSGGGDDDGLGGGGSTGGDGEDGGVSPSGGRTGSGGRSSSGGRSGSGGQSATGGRSGSGGTEMETGGASFGGACVSSGEGGFGGLGGFGGALSTEVFGGEGIYLLCSENSFGLQGMFHLADDSMGAADDGLIHSDLEPDTGGTAESGEEPSAFGDDTVMPCVSGSTARVTGASGEDCISDDCLWAVLWGGSIILDLT